MAAPACTTPRRQSYGSLLCQHADSGNWRKLTILCMVGDCRSCLLPGNRWPAAVRSRCAGL